MKVKKLTVKTAFVTDHQKYYILFVLKLMNWYGSHREFSFKQDVRNDIYLYQILSITLFS